MEHPPGDETSTIVIRRRVESMMARFSVVESVLVSRNKSELDLMGWPVLMSTRSAKASCERTSVRSDQGPA